MDDDFDVACVAGAFLILAYAYITKRQIERRMGSHKKRHRRNSSSSSSSSSSDDRLSHKRKLTGPLDISKKKRRMIQKRKRSPSSSSGSENLSSSSSSSSITSSSSSSEDERHQKKKEKMKLKRLKPKKECKHKKVDKEKVEKLKNSKKGEKLKPEEPEKSSDIPIDLMDKAKAMAPMTKEQWEKKQSVVRRVYDESTGRHRLIKGDGEVIEEPVSKDRHKAINKQATKGDGKFFQSQMRK